MRGWLFALASCALALACGAPDDAPEWAPSTSARATLVLEPPVLAVGEVARLDLAVVTPPDRIVQPPRGPASQGGLAILDRAALVTRRESARWVHTQTLRLRALEVGVFELDAGEVEIEALDGERERLVVPPLSVEVVSVFPEHAGQGSPYGVRRIPMRSLPGVSALGAFLAGAGLALAGVAFVALARRRLRAADAFVPPPETPGLRALDEAKQALTEARAQADRNPRGALDVSAQALRRYADARFGADLSARTVDELSRAEPPFLLTTRWPAFLALLHELDGTRFPREVEAEAVVRLIERSVAFVTESAPADPR